MFSFLFVWLFAGLRKYFGQNLMGGGGMGQGRTIIPIFNVYTDKEVDPGSQINLQMGTVRGVKRTGVHTNWLTSAKPGDHTFNDGASWANTDYTICHFNWSMLNAPNAHEDALLGRVGDQCTPHDQFQRQLGKFRRVLIRSNPEEFFLFTHLQIWIGYLCPQPVMILA